MSCLLVLVSTVVVLGVLLGKGRSLSLKTFHLFKNQLENVFVVCTLRS